MQTASTVVDTLYRNKASLEAVFRIIDKDNSGYISLEEFSDACELINKHMPNPITKDQLLDICRLMDMNKDGLVDLNEFLETFRMVDQKHREQCKEIEEAEALIDETKAGVTENGHTANPEITVTEVTIERTDAN